MKLEPYESTIGQHFRALLKNKNLITNEVLGYINTNHGIAEISTGAKFLDIEMFGVTIVNSYKHDTEKSKCVNSMKEVEEYIEELRYENHDHLIELFSKSNLL